MQPADSFDMPGSWKSPVTDAERQQLTESFREIFEIENDPNFNPNDPNYKAAKTFAILADAMIAMGDFLETVDTNELT